MVVGVYSASEVVIWSARFSDGLTGVRRHCFVVALLDALAAVLLVSSCREAQLSSMLNA